MSETDRALWERASARFDELVELAPDERAARLAEIERAFSATLWKDIENCSISGGEPTTRNDLVDIVRISRPGAIDSAARTANAHMYPPCTPTNDDQPASRWTRNSPAGAWKKK